MRGGRVGSTLVLIPEGNYVYNDRYIFYGTGNTTGAANRPDTEGVAGLFTSIGTWHCHAHLTFHELLSTGTERLRQPLLCCRSQEHVG
jgi:hypothetical protein